VEPGLLIIVEAGVGLLVWLMSRDFGGDHSHRLVMEFTWFQCQLCPCLDEFPGLTCLTSHLVSWLRSALPRETDRQTDRDR
jgi:hypothetical protein